VEPRTLKRLVAAAVLAAAAAGAAVWWARRNQRPLPVVGQVIEVRAPTGVRIKVEVINATPTRGLARRATMFLRDRGFDVVRYATDTVYRDTTLVLDRSGNAEWARLVGGALGDARIESRPDSSRYLDVSVLLGRRWRPPAKPFYP